MEGAAETLLSTRARWAGLRRAVGRGIGACCPHGRTLAGLHAPGSAGGGVLREGGRRARKPKGIIKPQLYTGPRRMREH